MKRTSSLVGIAVSLFAATSGAQTQQTRFLGAVVWEGPLPVAPHRALLDAAARITQPFRAPAQLDPAAYARFLNGPAAARLRRDAQDLAAIGAAARQLGDSAADQRLKEIVLAFSLEASLRHRLAVDAADPARATNASAGIGADENARAAAVVEQHATACAAAAPVAAATPLTWETRCQALATEMHRFVEERCAAARLRGLAQPGTFCGDH